MRPSGAAVDDLAEAPPHHRHRQQKWLPAALTAIGIVYGDIGTSPLYAFQVALGDVGPAGPSPADVLGILSLIFWAIIVVVALKYVTVVMRADNEGEGGILALLSLVMSSKRLDRAPLPLVVVLGVIGAAFIYGDGIITPAISVLSAIEGLDVAAPALKNWILPATVTILIALFALQSRGTGRIGRLFGPVMTLWFIVIGALGLAAILRNPAVLVALNPSYAIQFLAHADHMVFVVVGAAFLALTGAEALYADMGHVGAASIRRAWFGLVLPALALSYFGQGALVLSRPDTAANPFFNLAPEWAAMPLVVLAAVATVIASQALISGAFSLTRQAMQMRLLPRMMIKPTSGQNQGEIYIGAINWALMGGSVIVVLIFRTSGHLAAAYGIAVSAAMLVTSILLFEVVRHRWRWPLPAAIGLVGLFAAVDSVFLAANATKFEEGGWFPLVVGGVLAFLMLVWRSGTLEVQRRMEEMSVPFQSFLESLDRDLVTRIPGCAVVLTRNIDHASPTLVQQMRHNRVIHQHVILMTIQPVGRPVVAARDRLEITDLGRGFHRVVVKLGFMQTADLPAYVKGCVRLGMECAKGDIHYLVAYEHVSRRPRKSYFPPLLWHTFSLMSKTGVRLTDFLQVADKHVFEIGIKVQI